MTQQDKMPRAYRYEYHLTYRFGHWRHSYQLIGRWGAIEFHVTDLGEAHGRKYGDRYSTGLECHYREPPDYMADQPPSHDDCWLLKSPCWHDGTSLYAQETLLPLFKVFNHQEMFRHLAADADERFTASAIEARRAETPSAAPCEARERGTEGETPNPNPRDERGTP